MARHDYWMFRRHPLLSVTTVIYLAVVCWITLGAQPINTGNGLALACTALFLQPRIDQMAHL